MKYDSINAKVNMLYVIEELGIHESRYGDFERSHIEQIYKWEEKTAEKGSNRMGI